MKIARIVTLITTLVITGLFLINGSVASATSSPSARPDIGALGPSASKPQKRVIDHTYMQMTYSNLYKLVWAHDAFTVENVEALNAFLSITECNLYKKFFHNEFEWEKIRIATKEYLKNTQTKTPRYYEYVQPIFMGRYDYALQGFPIVNADNFKGQKNFQFASYRNGETECGNMDFDYTKYPGTGVLSVASPLNLSFIRVPIKLAQKYIEWRSKQDFEEEDNKRQAYIRYRIRIDAYEGIKQFKAASDSYSFRGKLMRIDVFADQEMLLPLYNQVF